MSPADRKEANRKSSLAWYYRNSREFMKRGLTCKGQRRERRASRSEVEIAWQQLRSEIGAVTIPEVTGAWVREER